MSISEKKLTEKEAWKEVVKTVKKLDPKKLEIIKATLPVVKDHGEAITKRFYKRMFENHPELKNIFNMAHQVTGHQPKALADAVYGAAANIEDFTQIMPVLERIGQKHRSLQIRKIIRKRLRMEFWSASLSFQRYPIP